MAVLVYKDARLCTADGDLAVHRFERAAGTSPNGAVVVVFHGYGAHAHFPTVRYAAEVLAAAGNVVYCLDFPGHGASPGTRGLVRSSEQLTTIGRAMARWATEQQPDRALALFGSSMGGAIALNVCRREPDIVATVVVAAPMLGIAPASLPPVWQQNLLWGMAWLAPAAALLPQANQTDLAQQYRDPVRRKECAADELAYSGWMRLGSACACLETVRQLDSCVGLAHFLTHLSAFRRLCHALLSTHA